jgi:hypothetical protein
MPAGHRTRCSAALGLAALLLTGCASTQRPEVQRVATAFENTGGDPETRCDLLTPKTRAALEQNESQSCAEAIGQLQLDGGNVESVQVWGGDAQVRLSGDTLFLTETHAGWRVSAAACQPNGDAPYDCQVEAG